MVTIKGQQNRILHLEKELEEMKRAKQRAISYKDKKVLMLDQKVSNHKEEMTERMQQLAVLEKEAVERTK